MTEKKENTILKAAKGFFPYFATPAMLAAGLFFGAKFIAKSEQTQFDSPEEKVKVIDHVEAAPSDVDSYIAFKKLDSLTKAEKKNAEDAIRSRKRRDSLFELQATTIYQMKQQQQEILEKIDNN